MCFQYECYLNFDYKYNHAQDIHIDYLFEWPEIWILPIYSNIEEPRLDVFVHWNCHMCLEISEKCWQSKETTRKVCSMKWNKPVDHASLPYKNNWCG